VIASYKRFLASIGQNTVNNNTSFSFALTRSLLSCLPRRSLIFVALKRGVSSLTQSTRFICTLLSFFRAAYRFNPVTSVNKHKFALSSINTPLVVSQNNTSASSKALLHRHLGFAACGHRSKCLERHSRRISQAPRMCLLLGELPRSRLAKTMASPSITITQI